MPTPLTIPIIAVVGSRHSGKTTTVETIIEGLTAKGYKVAAAKHIHQHDFTIDTEGRDTWRHAQAGAHVMVAVAAKELTTMRKVDTAKFSLGDIVKNCEDNTDVIVVEGFRDLVAKDITVPKVVTAKNKREMREAMQVFKPILAFCGLVSQAELGKQEIPVVDIRKEPEKLIEIIDRRVGPIVKKTRETKDAVSIDINGKMLPLNPYVQKVVRNVLFGVISTLKGANTKGNENIKITIATPKK